MTLSEEFAIESARISGYEPSNGDQMLTRHMELASYALHGSRRLSSALLNMSLFDDRELRLRAGIPGGMGAFLPRGTYSRMLVDRWDRAADKVVHSRWSLSDNEKVDLSWRFHDFLMCAHPFARGNGRTARLAWASLRTALGLPVEIVYYEQASSYQARIEQYRGASFVPWMRRRGYIT